MYDTQQKEALDINTKTSFDYTDLRIKMYHEVDNVEKMGCSLKPVVELYWKTKLLCRCESLPAAIKDAFINVRVCRPDFIPVVGEDRTEILIALESLGELSGMPLSIFFDTPSVEHRMYASSDVAKRFKHWDDIPSIIVECGLSSIDRHSFNGEAVFYKIKLSTYGTTLSVKDTGPVWKLPDVQARINELLIKHFA